MTGFGGLLTDLAGRLRSLPDGRSGGPLVVAGMFRTAHGIGQSAVSCFEALEAAGLCPLAVDTSGILNQIDAPSPVPLSDMPASAVGTLVLHANGPETPPILNALFSNIKIRWRVIGMWAWELTVAPTEWLEHAALLTELWTPSDFVTDVFAGQVCVPVRTATHRISVPRMAREMSARPTDASGPPRVLAMADGRSSFHRKNVIGAARIFRNAAEGHPDARLTLKLRNLSEFPVFREALHDAIRADHRITVIDGNLPSDERWRMIAECDILLSPHRSEGFGMHIAEAMALGRAVIATGWSGNMQFMTPENSVLLPYTLEPAHDPFNVYSPREGAVWAKVDEAEAAAALGRLMADHDMRRRLGARAEADIGETLQGTDYLRHLNAPPLNARRKRTGV